MELTEQRSEKALTVAVAGRLDSASSAGFESKLLGVITAGERAVILECTALAYLSSAGLRALLVAAKKMKAAGGQLVIAALRDEVREVFELSGFDTVFPTFATAADAEASF